MQNPMQLQNSQNNNNNLYSIPYYNSGTDTGNDTGNENSLAADSSQSDNDTQATQNTNASGILLAKFQGQMLAMAGQNEDLQDELDVTQQQLLATQQQLQMTLQALQQQTQQQQQQSMSSPNGNHRNLMDTTTNTDDFMTPNSTPAKSQAAADADQLQADYQRLHETMRQKEIVIAEFTVTAEQQLQRQVQDNQRLQAEFVATKASLEEQLLKQIQANRSLQENIQGLVQANEELQTHVHTHVTQCLSSSDSNDSDESNEKKKGKVVVSSLQRALGNGDKAEIDRLNHDIESLKGELVNARSTTAVSRPSSGDASITADVAASEAKLQQQIETVEELKFGIRKQEDDNEQLKTRNIQLKKQLVDKDKKLLEQVDEIEEMAHVLNQGKHAGSSNKDSQVTTTTSRSMGRQEYGSADESLAQLQPEISNLKAEIARLQNVLELEQKSLKQGEHQLNIEQQRSGQQESEIISLKAQLEAKTTKLDALIRDNTIETEAEIVRLTEQLKAKTSDFDGAMNRHNAESEFLRAEILRLKEQAGQETDALRVENLSLAEQLETKTADLIATTTQHNRQAESLRAEVSQLHKQVVATASAKLDLLSPFVLENMPSLCKPKQEKLPALLRTLAGDASINDHDDLSSIKHALSQLANMLQAEKEGDGIRASLCRSYGHLLVIQVMHRHANSVDIQEQCFRVISALCLVNKSISLSSVGGIGNICNGLAAVGTLQCVLAAMASHPDDVKLHKRAVRAMNNMMSSKDIVPLFFDLDIFPALIACMMRFAEDSVIQEDGCRILRFVGIYPQAREMFKKEGALRMLAGVIERFDDESNTYKQACRAWSVVVG